MRELRYAVRSLRRRPGFTLAAVVTLALGIGANTAVFSVIRAVILRPLPLPRPDRLVVIWGTTPRIPRETASLPDFADWREQTRSFSAMGAFSRRVMNLSGDGDPQRVVVDRVTGDLFGVLAVVPVVGRLLAPGDDRPDGAKVAVLAESLWRTRFGADPGVVGRTVRLDGGDYTVVGVAPAAAHTLGGPPGAFVPLGLGPAAADRRADFLVVIARLAPQVTLTAARSEMTALAARLERTYPETNTDWTVRLVPLHEQMIEALRSPLMVLWGAVALVLLIACTNVANLVLVGAVARCRELAVRTALGAGRRQLVQQLLAEHLLLGLGGAALGVALAKPATRAIIAASPVGVPLAGRVGVDLPVLVFSALLAVAVAAALSLVPLVAGRGRGLALDLREGGRGALEGRSHGRLRRAFVVVEVTLAVALLVAAGLLLRTVGGLAQADPGLSARGVVVASLDLTRRQAETPGSLEAFAASAVEAAGALPGVTGAAIMAGAYFAGGAPYLSFDIAGRPAPPLGQESDAEVRATSAGTEALLGIQLRRGRLFDRDDGAHTALVAVVNETFVRRYLGTEDPLGQGIAFDSVDGQPRWREIVGVIGDVHQDGVDQPVNPEIHVPLTQGRARSVTLLLATERSPASLSGEVTALVRRLDPELPVSPPRALSELVGLSAARQRFTAVLLSAFAGLALFLATLGISAVVATTVSSRRRDIGLRMALGAGPGRVLTAVVVDGMKPVLIGLAAGLVAAIAVTRGLAGLLFGVGPLDPSTYAAVTALLVVVALLAALVPGLRAARVDPSVALRTE